MTDPWHWVDRVRRGDRARDEAVLAAALGAAALAVVGVLALAVWALLRVVGG